MPTHTLLESQRSLLSNDVWVGRAQTSSVPSNSRYTASGTIIPYSALRRTLHFTRRIGGQDKIYGMPTHTSLESQRSLLSNDVWVGRVPTSSVPSNLLCAQKTAKSGTIIP